ncbi:hypothetical protein ACE6H2_001747 [Prunus campanulata]
MITFLSVLAKHTDCWYSAFLSITHYLSNQMWALDFHKFNCPYFFPPETFPFKT